MSNDEGWNRFAKSFFKQTEYIHSTFDVGRSMLKVRLWRIRRLSVSFSIKLVASTANGGAESRTLNL
jgi:hypothetical protein